MIVERLYPESHDSLRNIVCRHASDVDAVVVQAGHYLVYYDHTEDLVLPCVREELRSPRHSVIVQSVGIFPLLTWQLGMDFLQGLQAGRKGIFTVVNDWQYLPAHIDRTAFYRSYPKLFDSYAALLDKRDAVSLITQQDFGSKVKTGVWFSEVSLRNQYKRQVQKLIKHNNLPLSAELVENSNGLSCSLHDAVGNRQEIYCTGKSSSCTQEIAELVRQVSRVGKYDLLINIYPLVCREYIQSGTELSFELWFPGDFKVVNIGLPSSGISGVADVFSVNEISVHLPREEEKEGT